MKSLASIPIKTEMGVVKHTSDHALTPAELADQIEEARKGTARVDSKYVDYEGHLYNYEYNWPQFLDNMIYIINKGKVINNNIDDSHLHDTHHGTDNRRY